MAGPDGNLHPLRAAGDRHHPSARHLDQAKRLGPENEPPYEDWGILPSEWPAYEDEANGRA